MKTTHRTGRDKNVMIMAYVKYDIATESERYPESRGKLKEFVQDSDMITCRDEINTLIFNLGFLQYKKNFTKRIAYPNVLK